jgi:hypothetical protein
MRVSPSRRNIVFSSFVGVGILVIVLLLIFNSTTIFFLLHDFTCDDPFDFDWEGNGEGIFNGESGNGGNGDIEESGKGGICGESGKSGICGESG